MTSADFYEEGSGGGGGEHRTQIACLLVSPWGSLHHGVVQHQPLSRCPADTGAVLLNFQVSRAMRQISFYSL
jgi:hypothetical protein